MKNFLRRYGLTIAWAALLFGLSSISDLSSPVNLFSWDDKIQHALAYMPFGWLLLRSLAWKRKIHRGDFGFAIIIGVLYSVTDEIHQYFVPGRFMDWTDAVADAIGVTVGGWIFYRWQERWFSKQQANAQAPGENVGGLA